MVVAAKDGRLTDYDCRRPCVDEQPRKHLVGPLYADNASVAEVLLRRMCADVIGRQSSFTSGELQTSRVTKQELRFGHKILLFNLR